MRTSPQNENPEGFEPEGGLHGQAFGIYARAPCLRCRNGDCPDGRIASRRGAELQVDAPAAGEAATDDTPEILVTARRREESLQDTPVAISAFSAEMLEDRQITQTQDLERITPSLQFKPAGQLSGNSASSVVFIRGVGQLDPTAAVDPGVGIYLDEVYLGRAVGGAIEFGDIASVEVLRGPQGTLFGRNTIGGAILVRTRQPELGEFSGRAPRPRRRDDLYEGFAALNMPIGDTVAARVSGGFRKRDGYVIRAFDGLDLGNDNGYSLNGALKWEPIDRLRPVPSRRLHQARREWRALRLRRDQRAGAGRRDRQRRRRLPWRDHSLRAARRPAIRASARPTCR